MRDQSGQSLFSADRGGIAVPRPPWAVVLVILLGMGAIGILNWPGFRGPAKDYQLNCAIYEAAHHSFAPDALKSVKTIDAHAWRIYSFQGIAACPNLERLYINEESIPYWRQWADSQFTNPDPLHPDVRPTIPSLPHLHVVKVGAPGSD